MTSSRQCKDRPKTRSPLVPLLALRRAARDVRRLGRGTGFRASLRLGILGGSFNPAHKGHLQLSQVCARRLLLGRVLWLVARHNPLKDKDSMLSFPQRFHSCQTLLERHLSANNPLRCIVLSDAEQRFDLTYSAHSCKLLQRAFPQHQWVFLMGADAFAQIARWHAWRQLAQQMALLVFPRRSWGLRARLSAAARSLASSRAHDLSRIVRAGKRSRWGFLPTQTTPYAATPIRLSQPLGLARKALEEMQALDIVEIDLEGKTDIADSMLVATARSGRHLKALRNHVLEAFRGFVPARLEGENSEDWALIDADSLIVHLFLLEARQRYDLEGLWGEGTAARRETAALPSPSARPRGVGVVTA